MTQETTSGAAEGWQPSMEGLTWLGRVLYRLGLIRHEMRGSVVRMRAFWQRNWH